MSLKNPTQEKYGIISEPIILGNTTSNEIIEITHLVWGNLVQT